MRRIQICSPKLSKAIGNKYENFRDACKINIVHILSH